MILHPTALRYTAVAILLHWTIAALILFNLALGFFMEGFPPHLRVLVVTAHVSSGITVLALTVLRVIWRLLNEPPAFPADLRPWERHAAHIVHLCLYLAMVLMPVTGWAIISAHPAPGSPGAAYVSAHQPAPPPALPGAAPSPPPRGAPIKLWWIAPLPPLAPVQEVGRTAEGVAPQTVLHDHFVDWHSLGAWTLIGLLVLHVGGALKHQLIDRHAELARMGMGKPKIV